MPLPLLPFLMHVMHVVLAQCVARWKTPTHALTWDVVLGVHCCELAITVPAAVALLPADASQPATATATLLSRKTAPPSPS